MSRLISRDPFARTELHRHKRFAKGQASGMACKECGQPSESVTLYQYSTETDGGRKFFHSGLYCSVGCFRAHG